MRRLPLAWILVLAGCGGPEPHDATSNQLRASLASADTLRVRTGGTCHRDTGKEVELFKTTSRSEIQELLDLIRVDESESGLHCMCCGDPTLEFYIGEKLIGTVGVHHGTSLRWIEGTWDGDGMLTRKSAKALTAWLAAKGIDEPNRDRIQGEANAKQAKASWAKWEAATPKGLEELSEGYEYGLSDEQLKQARAALAGTHRKVSEQIRALFKWYGSGESWNGYPAYEGLARDILLSYSDAQLMDAVSLPDLSEVELDGAARLCVFDLKRDRIELLKKLPAEPRKRLLDYCLRAGSEKKEWGEGALKD